MKRDRWRAISDVVDGPDATYAIVGLWDRQECRGAVGIGVCERPAEVGRVGRRLARAAKKIAKSKALKRIATTAGRAAVDAYGGTAAKLLDLATTASRTSRELERSAIRDAPGLTPDQIERAAREGDEAPRLADELHDDRYYDEVNYDYAYDDAMEW